MTEKIKKRDFVEIEFLGKTDGEVFDTNILSELKKINTKAEPSKLVVIVGEEMLIKGFDNALEGKEIGREYSIHLKPEEAYGKRESKLVKLVPKQAFAKHNLNPVAGMMVQLDNTLAKIISVSGGRVMVDFNNALAGKELDFDFTVKKKVSDLKEKVNALQNFFFRQEFEFDLDDVSKKIIFKDINLTQILNLFKDKFKEFTGYDVEIFAKTSKQEEKTSEK